MRSAVALVGLVLSLAERSFAQQKVTVDPKIEQQIRVLAAKYDEAFNKNDAATVARLFTEDAVVGTPHGTFHGRQAIEKDYAQHDFQDYLSKNLFTNVDRVIAVGNEVRSTGRWSDTIQDSGVIKQVEGHYSMVWAREGDTWKIRRHTWDINVH
jgi:uncharacterized protein (TIGR02246 family)